MEAELNVLRCLADQQCWLLKIHGLLDRLKGTLNDKCGIKQIESHLVRSQAQTSLESFRTPDLTLSARLDLGLGLGSLLLHPRVLGTETVSIVTTGIFQS